MKKLFTTLLVAVAVFMGVSTLSALAGGGGCVTPPNGWSGPGSTPPNGNVCPPINTGTSWQAKAGSLGIGVDPSTGNTITRSPGTVFDVLGGAVIDSLATINLYSNHFTLKGGTPPMTLTPKSVLADMDGNGIATWQPLSALTSSGGGPGGNVIVDKEGSTLPTPTSFTLASNSNVYISAQADIHVVGGGVSGGGMGTQFTDLRLIVNIDNIFYRLNFNGGPLSGSYGFISGSDIIPLAAGPHTISMDVTYCGDGCPSIFTTQNQVSYRLNGFII